ncbi:MAG: SGNH/GDSL hydrolase family protein [Candidatus Omnitrophica bacterium]|nr:SGNH/GDSL hydrolase family protein [Candidatus Omnitrophota bacterium]
MTKKIIYSLVIMVVVTCLTLCLAEIIVRIFSPKHDKMQCVVPDQKYGYFMKKNFSEHYRYPGSDHQITIQTNRWGLRGTDYDASRLSNPAVTKVLLLGDSYTFGYGVNREDTFAYKLETLLNASGNAFLVINAGVGGWGTLQEITYAKDHFRVFKPDIIVFTFCRNDPKDDLKFSHNLYGGEKGLMRFPGKQFFRHHSHLYDFLFRVFHGDLETFLFKQKMRQKKIPFDTARRRPFNSDRITEEEWKRTGTYITNFYKEFLAFNTKGVVFVQSAEPWNMAMRSHLQSLSHNKNLRYIDLYDEAIILTPDKRSLPYDPHWSPAVHSLSAKKLCKVILGRE